MMTGAPKSGVTALRGIMPPSAGNVQSRLQSRANTVRSGKTDKGDRTAEGGDHCRELTCY